MNNCPPEEHKEVQSMLDKKKYFVSQLHLSCCDQLQNRIRRLKWQKYNKILEDGAPRKRLSLETGMMSSKKQMRQAKKY